MLVGAGVELDPRAPIDALVRLTFGSMHDAHARLLARAHRAGVGEGELAEWIERTAGRPAAAVPPVVVPIAADGEEYVLLLAKAVDAGSVQIVGRVEGEPAMVEQARRRLGH